MPCGMCHKFFTMRVCSLLAPALKPNLDDDNMLITVKFVMESIIKNVFMNFTNDR